MQRFEIRRAKKKDVDLIYCWANDEEVRKQSFNSDPIPYETHCKWFESKLADTNYLIYILEYKGLPAGLVRFEIDNNEALVGFSIDEQFRGKGISSELLMIAAKEYFNDYSFPIIAAIKQENVASKKSFKKTGFVFLREEEINGVNSSVYQLEKLSDE